MHAIHLTQRAQKFLDRLDRQARDRVERRLKQMGQSPVPANAKFIGRISGEKVFRVRIGSYRVLYSINESASAIVVHKIDKRSRVYHCS